MHQNSPTAISDFKIFPGEKPPDPRFQGGRFAAGGGEKGGRGRGGKLRPPPKWAAYGPAIQRNSVQKHNFATSPFNALLKSPQLPNCIEKLE